MSKVETWGFPMMIDWSQWENFMYHFPNVCWFNTAANNFKFALINLKFYFSIPLSTTFFFSVHLLRPIWFSIFENKILFISSHKIFYFVNTWTCANKTKVSETVLWLLSALLHIPLSDDNFGKHLSLHPSHFSPKLLCFIGLCGT